ncbi:MAG: OmpA family protein [Mariprofundus sp.]
MAMVKLSALLLLLPLFVGCKGIIGPEPGQAPSTHATAQQNDEHARNNQLREELSALREAVKTERSRLKQARADQGDVVVAPVSGSMQGQLWVRLSFRSGQKYLDAKSRKALTDIAGKFISEPRSQRISVQGFCDTEPIGGYSGNNQSSHGYDSQLALSQARADAVADILVKAGIPRQAIQAQGFGASHFIADNGSKTGRDKNRRVDIFLIGE